MMVKAFIRNILLGTVLSIFGLSCSKEKGVDARSGVFFFPAESEVFYNRAFTSSIQNGRVTIPVIDRETKLISCFNYDFNSRKLESDISFNKSDTNQIVLLQGLPSGNFVGIARDTRLSVTTYSTYKIILFDNKFNVIRQQLISDSVLYFNNLVTTGTGEFVAIYNSENPGRNTKLIRFDEDLKVKWKTVIKSQITSYQICISNNMIFLLENALVMPSYFMIRQYDINGKLVKSKSSPVNYLNSRIVASAEGFDVFSFYNSADKHNMLAISRYDFNSNLITTKFLESDKFSIPGSQFDVNSNFVKVGDGLCFAINLEKNSSRQDMILPESKLIKLNAQYDIEYVKELDDRRLMWGYKFMDHPGHLVLWNNRLLYTAKSIWNGIEGFSFILTDLDGNIVN